MYNGVHRGPIYVTAIMCLMAELTLHCASTLAVCAADPLGTQTSVATAVGRARYDFTAPGRG